MKNNYRNIFKAPGAAIMIIMFCMAAVQAGANTATWNNGAGNGLWNDAGNWTNASGGTGLPSSSDDVLIPNSALGNPILGFGDVAASLTIESGHTVTVSSGGYDLTVGGDITGAGTLDLSNHSGTVTVGGNFTIGTLTPGSSSTIAFNGATLQNVSANSFHSIADNNTGSGSNILTLTGNISVSGDISGTGKMATGSNNATVAGDISVASYNAGSGTTTLTGSLSVSTLVAGTSTFILNGTGTQINGGFTFYNLEIDNTGTSETLNNAETVGGVLSGTGTLDAGAETVTVDGNITINAIIPNNTVYILSGTSNQNITKGYTFYELHINNSAGVTLTGGDVTVSHVLAFGTGKVTLGSNNLIISTASTGLTGTFGAGTYVKTNGSGALEWSAATSGTVFPVGDASYNPITITPQSSADVFSVQAIDGVTDNSGNTGTANAVNMTWTVKPTSVSSQGVVVTPQWTASGPNQELPGFNHSSSSDDVTYRTNPASSWINTTSGTPTNANPIFSLASGNPGGVSDITMVNSGTPTYYIAVGGPTALPVELVAFNAMYNNGVVDLSWTTASEINNSHFDVERSVDGEIWNAIGRVDGHGTSMEVLHYTAEDNLAGVALSGNIYYRLKQVDFNGQYAYSPVRTVDIANVPNAISAYPNPATTQLNVEWVSTSESNTTLRISNITGSTVYTENFSGVGAIHKQIDLSALPVGMYSVQLVSDKSETTRLVYKY